MQTIYEKLARCESAAEIKRMLADNGVWIAPETITPAMIEAAERTMDDWEDSDYDSNADGDRQWYTYKMSGWQGALWLAFKGAAEQKTES